MYGVHAWRVAMVDKGRIEMVDNSLFNVSTKKNSLFNVHNFFYK